MCVIIMLRTSFRVNLHSIVCLIVKKLLAPSRRLIWSLSDSNGIRTYNYLVRKRTLNRLAKVFIYKLIGCGFESRYCHLRRRIQNPVRHLKRSFFVKMSWKPLTIFANNSCHMLSGLIQQFYCQRRFFKNRKALNVTDIATCYIQYILPLTMEILNNKCVTKSHL